MIKIMQKTMVIEGIIDAIQVCGPSKAAFVEVWAFDYLYSGSFDYLGTSE
jgi:hypothetical protein